MNYPSLSTKSDHKFFLQEKCADYMPPSEITDCHRLFGDFQITLKKREVKDKYIISSLQLKVSLEEIKVLIFS